MIKRLLSASFGAILFSILTPILFLLLVGVPNKATTLMMLVGCGVVIGAALGALFPRVFGFVFELFISV